MTIEDGSVLVEKMLSFARDRFKEDYDAIVLGHCHDLSYGIMLWKGKRKLLLP